MAELRFCQSGGLLVGGKDRIPSDPSDYAWPAGCNRLFCPSCQAFVRSGPPGLWIKPDVTFPDHKALFTSENWAELKFVEQTKSLNRRLYSCKCTHWETTGSVAVENDGDSPSDPRVPWRCAGHPAPSLPVELDNGITVAADSDWGKLVDTILKGTSPRTLGIRNEGPFTWLNWLYLYLAGLPAADQLSHAIAGRIGDADPLVVGRVLRFFSLHPRAAGIERLLAAATVDKIAVGQTIPEGRSPAPWDVVIARLENRGTPRDGADARALELFRQAALGPPSSSGDVVRDALEQRFAAFDDDDDLLWLANHVVDIDKAAPGRWLPVMNRLVSSLRPHAERDHLVVIAGQRLLGSGTVALDELRAWMDGRANKRDAWAVPLGLALDEKMGKSGTARN